MTLLLNALLVVQILTALVMIGLILIQHGKGADMGAAFGGGSSGSLFGASGSANFLSRSTSVLAAVFFVCTLALAYFGNLKPTTEGSSVLETAPLNLPTGPAVQIPGQNDPASTNAPANAVPAPASSGTPNGAGQIPK
jgi:preprotein translocase subunit SecG